MTEHNPKPPLRDLRWHTCTKDDPWTKGIGKRGIHPDASEVGEQRDGYPGGDIVSMHCPNCDITWDQELPQ